MQYLIDKQTQDLGFRVIAERAHEPMALIEGNSVLLNRAARLMVSLFKIPQEASQRFFLELAKTKRHVHRVLTAHGYLRVIITGLPEGPHRFLVEVVRA